MPTDLAKLKYVAVTNYSGAPVISIRYFNDFIQQLEESKPNRVYRHKEEYSDTFLFLDSGVIYSFYGYAYKNLQDIKTAIALGFSGAGQKFQIHDGEIQLYNRYYNEGRSPEGDVYYAVIKAGYKDFKEFEEAFSNGFKDAESFHKAENSGFKDYRSYKDAEEKGFSKSTEYEAASEIGIKSKTTYDEYLKLKQVKDQYQFEKFDEAHAFVILNRKELGKKKSIQKIQEILDAEKPSYESKWYTKSFSDSGWNQESEKLVKFIQTDRNVALLGSYDSSSETFENYSDTKILVDGSNVAWNNGSRKAGDLPDGKNILLVVNALKSMGYSDINALCDAKTQREILNPDTFNDLIKEKYLRVMPSKTDADAFIIEFAKRFHSRIVTNDTYKDWAIKDPWVAENVDVVSIRFQILDGEVVLHSASQGIKDNGFLSKEFEFKGFTKTKNERSWR